MRYSSDFSRALMWKPGRIFMTAAIWNELPRPAGSREAYVSGFTTSRPEGTCEFAAGDRATHNARTATKIWAIADFTGSPERQAVGDNAAHDGVEVLAGLFEDEGVARIVPAQLEAGGKRGDPDFADGRVGGD